MFLPKRQLRHINPKRESGLVVQLFEKDRMTIESAEIDDSIKILIGFDGKISIKNELRRSDLIYHSSSSGQLPMSNCYEFKILDKGWRIDAEIWTTKCNELKDSTFFVESNAKNQNPIYQTFLTLDTPISRSRKLRSVAISKSGDGAIDFLLQELQHSQTIRVSFSFLLFLLSFFAFH